MCAIWSNSNTNANADREPNPNANAYAMHREMCTHAEATSHTSTAPLAFVSRQAGLQSGRCSPRRDFKGTR